MTMRNLYIYIHMIICVYAHVYTCGEVETGRVPYVVIYIYTYVGLFLYTHTHTFCTQPYICKSMLFQNRYIYLGGSAIR